MSDKAQLEALKKLRQRTGAGVNHCNQALRESGWDLDKAAEWLQKKNITKASSKVGRSTGAGLVGARSSEDGLWGALVELNSETDFVARNLSFQELTSKALRTLEKEKSGSLESLLETSLLGHPETVAHHVTQLSGTLGENLALRRVASCEVDQGVVVPYVHMTSSMEKTEFSQELGNIGVLVALSSQAPQAELSAIGKKIAMQVAATRPLALRREDITPQQVQKEQEIARAKAVNNEIPQANIERVVSGATEKFFQENVLLEQKFVYDSKQTIQGFLQEEGKRLGSPIEVVGFQRFEAGEEGE